MKTYEDLFEHLLMGGTGKMSFVTDQKPNVGSLQASFRRWRASLRNNFILADMIKDKKLVLSKITELSDGTWALQAELKVKSSTETTFVQVVKPCKGVSDGN